MPGGAGRGGGRRGVGSASGKREEGAGPAPALALRPAAFRCLQQDGGSRETGSAGGMSSGRPALLYGLGLPDWRRVGHVPPGRPPPPPPRRGAEGRASPASPAARLPRRRSLWQRPPRAASAAGNAPVPAEERAKTHESCPASPPPRGSTGGVPGPALRGRGRLQPWRRGCGRRASPARPLGTAADPVLCPQGRSAPECLERCSSPLSPRRWARKPRLRSRSALEKGFCLNWGSSGRARRFCVVEGIFCLFTGLLSGSVGWFYCRLFVEQGDSEER